MQHHGHVPFHPPPGRAEPNSCFDSYRERAGGLVQDGEPFGVLYLRFDTCWWQIGGRLWWRRWSEPKEQVTGRIEFSHGGFDDFVADADTVVDEVEEWNHGRFPYRGEVLTVEWLDDPSSRRARMDTFGLGENPDVERPH